MSDYKTTDTDLTAVANAIRARREIETPLVWPTGFISEINKIGRTIPDIVSWSSGTDAEIVAMVEALDQGLITVEDTEWEIGDERVVSLSAMEATGVNESHAAQNVTFVLMDSGHFDLAGGGKDHFVVGMKDCLNETGYYNASRGVTWVNSSRKTWCDNVFYNAIPSSLRGIFKQFQYKIAHPTIKGSTLETCTSYFAFFGQKEVVGGTPAYQNTYESDTETQIEYYKTSSNHIKKVNGSNEGWWCRSVRADGSNAGYGACCIVADGSGSGASYDNNKGLSPFGCI